MLISPYSPLGTLEIHRKPRLPLGVLLRSGLQNPIVRNCPMGKVSFERKEDDQGTPGADGHQLTRGFEQQNLGDTDGGVYRPCGALSRDSTWTGQTMHAKDFAVIPIRSFLRILVPGQVQARLLSSPPYPRFGHFKMSVWVIRSLPPLAQTVQFSPPHHVYPVILVSTCQRPAVRHPSCFAPTRRPRCAYSIRSRSPEHFAAHNPPIDDCRARATRVWERLCMGRGRA